jgi:hypothetical protein
MDINFARTDDGVNILKYMKKFDEDVQNIILPEL